MNPDVLIAHIEDEWKEMEPDYRERFRRQVSRRFTDDERRRIFEQLQRKCTYLPRVSQVYAAAEDLLISTEPTRNPEPKGCAKCRGTTWLMDKWEDPRSGRTYETVKQCSCAPRKIKPKYEGEVPF